MKKIIFRGCVIGLLIICVSSLIRDRYAKKQLIYENGHLQVCKDMHKGDKLKFELAEKSNGTREWIRVEKLNAWDDKNYFDKAMLTLSK